MAKTELLSPHDLRQLICYNAISGDFFWRHRPATIFKTQAAFKIWNVKFSGKEAFFTDTPEGYKRGVIFKRPYKAHRVAWAVSYGEWPDQIDHIDHNRTNNKLSNLRNVSIFDNNRNVSRSKVNTSGITGVSWDNRRGNWRAYIKTDGAQKYLGCFSSISDAAHARKRAERKLGFHDNHGD